eukprot:scaffold125875_cov30-Tisochrysis_lutea.AAC.2
MARHSNLCADSAAGGSLKSVSPLTFGAALQSAERGKGDWMLEGLKAGGEGARAHRGHRDISRALHSALISDGTHVLCEISGSRACCPLPLMLMDLTPNHLDPLRRTARASPVSPQQTRRYASPQSARFPNRAAFPRQLRARPTTVAPPGWRLPASVLDCHTLPTRATGQALRRRRPTRLLSCLPWCGGGASELSTTRGGRPPLSL